MEKPKCMHSHGAVGHDQGESGAASEVLLVLTCVCSLLDVAVYSRPPYMTVGCCLHACNSWVHLVQLT